MSQGIILILFNFGRKKSISKFLRNEKMIYLIQEICYSVGESRSENLEKTHKF